MIDTWCHFVDWLGSLPGGAVFAGMSALAAVASFLLTLRSGSSSEKAANAATESAFAARQSVQIMETQWTQSRRANLFPVITPDWTAGYTNSEGVIYVRHQIKVINNGMTSALNFNVHAMLEINADVNIWLNFGDRVLSEDSIDVEFTHPYIVDEPSSWGLSLQYIDGSGIHRLSFTAEVEFSNQGDGSTIRRIISTHQQLETVTETAGTVDLTLIERG